MVKFLLHRPIAVTMTFIAIMAVGIVSFTRIPVSLLPDIAIPEITVRISEPDMPARELENSIVRPIRQQLMQAGNLDDIHSETQDGTSTIKLKFEYGSNLDFAFVEVNEKVDRAMGSLPQSISRPRVIKATVGDIPVFYLNLTLKGDSGIVLSGSKVTGSNAASCNLKPATPNLQTEISDLYPVSQSFVELSRFASNVICKRLEQLPEVAMVDMSGQAAIEMLIMPDAEKMKIMEITLEELEQIILSNHIRLGNLAIREGHYLYNVRFSSVLQNKEDIENIWLKKDSRLFQLKEIARVIEHPAKPIGLVLANGREAITLAVIKQSDAQINDMKSSLKELVARFEEDYPSIQFEITRDQTSLLDYALSNLGQSLWQGALLAFLMLFLFLRDSKSPFLIGITIPVTFFISLLAFYLIGLSINIISLSGLILGVGMMCDNSIVVIDNISQHYQRGLQAQQTVRSPGIPFVKLITSACISGTNEVIGPMLSSVLTNCAVFLPLIFISGISGALFYDQAVAIAIGAIVSWAVSITIIPVYYLLIFKRGNGFGENNWLKRINSINYEKAYETGFRFFIRRQYTGVIIIVVLLAGTILLFRGLPKSKLPEIEKDDIVLLIDWNEPVNIQENRQRVENYLENVAPWILQSTAFVGEQQFMLNKDIAGNSRISEIYIRANSPQAIDSIAKATEKYLQMAYKEASIIFKEADNLFNIIFSDNEPDLEARLRATSDFGPAYKEHLQKAYAKLRAELYPDTLPEITLQEHIVLNVLSEKLVLYGVSYQSLYLKLKSLFGENQLFLITDNTEFIPVMIGNRTKNIREIIEGSFIENNQGENIPVRELLEQTRNSDLESIVAGKEGEYYPVPMNTKEPGKMAARIQKKFKADGQFEVSFTGRYFSNKRMVRQLFFIFLISLMLLYFILASQFESLTLPLIILIEVPLDLFGAFILLKICGAGINLMSLIGIIVMAGIVVNDSILKIDTVKKLMDEGYGLIRSLLMAGQRRLKPILMTALATILGLLPVLFAGGLGADLQRPLALANIGGMIIGTFVSLYMIPLAFYWLKRGKYSKLTNSR